MINVKLCNRLRTIADLVRPDKIVLDIGTDHALLPCFLKQRGQARVIASDIGLNPLKSAAKTLSEYGNPDVILVQSDGFENIDYAEDIIIAGMGGETIAEIIAGCGFLNGDLRFILQPMTRHAELRRALCRMGFEILSEYPAKDDGKIYTIILATYTGEIREIDDLSAFTGLQTDREYIEAQLKKLRKICLSKPEYKDTIIKLEAILNDS